jgi:hypothetical protein
MLKFRAFSFLLVLVASLYSFELSIDQTGQSNILILNNYPLSIADGEIGAIRFDGALNLPYGAYKLFSLPEYEKSDTIKSRSMLNWRQGDYAYKEVGIGATNEIEINKTITFLGLTRSFPGMYANQYPENKDIDENVLQNYYLSIDSKTINSILNAGVFYHIENTGLPIDPTSSYYRKSESTHLGLTYKYYNDISNLDIHLATQFGNSEVPINTLETLSFQNLSRWNEVKYQIKILDNFQFSNALMHQSLSIETDDYVHHERAIFSSGLNLKFNSTNLFLGISGWQQKYDPVFELNFHRGESLFKLSRRTNFDFELLDANTITSNNEIINSISLDSYINNHLSIGFSGSIIELDEIDILVLDSEFELSFKNFNMSGEAMISPDTSMLINQYANIEIDINPVAWISLNFLDRVPLIGIMSWNEGKRFKPFVKLSGEYYNFTGNRMYDLHSISSLLYSNEPSFHFQRYNMEFGFKINNFVFCYKIQNMLDDNSNLLLNMQSNSQFRYFEVNWIFNQ